MTMQRREAIALLGAGLATTASAPVIAARKRGAAASRALDFTRQEDRLRAFMLMRGALDDRLVMSWANGRYFGIVDDVATPLFGVISCVFSRYRAVAGGGFEGVTVEFAYFTDPASGKVIDSFRNPFTGKDCAVPGGGYAPAKILIGPDLSFRLAKERPGFVLDHQVFPPVVIGDDVWITERPTSEMKAPGMVRPFRYSEVVTFHAKRSALEVPGALQVPCEVSFTNVAGWRPWLGMGGHPGHMSAIGFGKHGATRDTLPPAWVEATRARHPELYDDPAAILAPVWNGV